MILPKPKFLIQEGLIPQLAVPFLLVIFSLVICFANYAQGTFLSGWDTLHPEFNLKLYFVRILSGVWQEHQGLGAVASQAHAAELPRLAIILFFKLLLGFHNARYIYAFLMLILGPLGVYYFVSRAFMSRFSLFVREVTGLISGLFYLFNLVTLQQFYVPLEMFLTHYGFLGWVLYYLSQYFESPTKKNLLKFGIVSILITPQAHTPTLFYAYFLILSLFSFGYWLKNSDFSSITKIMMPLFLTFLLNTFWLLPHVYFLTNHSSEVGTSKIHSLFSEEAFLQNKQFGRIEDVSIMRNFLFNWGEHVGHAQFGDLLDEWTSHLQRPYVLLIGYIFFGVIVFALFAALFKRELYAYSLLFIFAISLFFLFTDNPPLGFLFRYLQNTFPVFKEALRFPFTKFSIPLVFVYSVLFGYGIAVLMSLFDKLFRDRMLRATLALTFYSSIIFALFYFALPMFFGRLISPSMRVDIPNRYFEMFNWLNEQDAYGRVADLPINSFWGWQYYNWDVATGKGYQGAGFLWFGIKQPLLNREFDRWNIINEQYYREMSTAVYAQDLQALENVLEKYKIRWVLYDKSIFAPSADQKSLFLDEIASLLDSSAKLTKKKVWDDTLFIYEYAPRSAQTFNSQYTTADFVITGDSLGNDYTDPIYSLYGDYAKSGHNSFPFVGITNSREAVSPAYIASDLDFVYLIPKTSDLPQGTSADPYQRIYSVAAKHTTAGIELYLLDETVSEHEVVANKVLRNDAGAAKGFYLLHTIQQDPGNPISVVKINNNFFNLSRDLSMTDYVLGKVVLGYKDKINLTIYKSESSFAVSDYRLFSSAVFKCGIVGEDSKFEIKYIEDGIELSAKNINTCVVYPLSSLINSLSGSSSVITVNADISSVKDGRAFLCLLNRKTGLCINNIHDSVPYTYDLAMALADETDVMFKLDGSLSYEEISSTFTNLMLTRNNPVSEFVIDPAAFLSNEYTQNNRLNFAKHLDFGGYAGTLITEPRLCDGVARRSAESAIISNADGTVDFISNSDSMCASIEFPSVSHETGYILEVKAKNVTGLPLRLCLTNEFSKRCDLYVSLGNNRDFTSQFYLIPPFAKGTGYTLNFSNLVFGESESRNSLEYVSLTPVPYQTLKSSHLSLPENRNKVLLVKNEAYEAGWMAVCGYLPCKAEHLTVNNWANGWLFDSTADAEAARVVFWPDYLEYFGLVVSILALLVLI